MPIVSSVFTGPGRSKTFKRFFLNGYSRCLWLKEYLTCLKQVFGRGCCCVWVPLKGFTLPSDTTMRECIGEEVIFLSRIKKEAQKAGDAVGKAAGKGVDAGKSAGAKLKEGFNKEKNK